MRETESWRRFPRVFLALALPQGLWLLAFFIVPLAYILLLSFSEKTGIVGHRLTFTPENYLRVLEPIYLGVFAKSLVIAAAATAVCLVVGYPVALAIAFAPRRLKTPLLIAVTLPFWINILVRTYALIAVFRTNGHLNGALEFFWNAGDNAPWNSSALKTDSANPSPLWTCFTATPRSRWELFMSSSPS